MVQRRYAGIAMQGSIRHELVMLRLVMQKVSYAGITMQGLVLNECLVCWI